MLENARFLSSDWTYPDPIYRMFSSSFQREHSMVNYVYHYPDVEFGEMLLM